MFTKEGKKEKRKEGRQRGCWKKGRKTFSPPVFKGRREETKEGRKERRKEGARRKKAKMFFSCGHATL